VDKKAAANKKAVDKKATVNKKAVDKINILEMNVMIGDI
jgi:hypothetical protein